MRQFGRVVTAIWQSQKFRALSQDGKILFFYLLACPHGNATGCFRLPLGYMGEDLEWPPEKVKTTVSELFANGLITFNYGLSIVRIIGWFGHNTIENRNVAKGAINALASLPMCEEKRVCFYELKTVCEQFSELIRNDFATVEQSFANTSPYPEPEPSLRDSVAKATDAAASSDGHLVVDDTADLKTRIFGPAREWLAKQAGLTDKAARTMLGKWCSQTRDDGRVLEALQQASRNAPLDPVPYIEKLLKAPRAGPGGQPQFKNAFAQLRLENSLGSGHAADHDDQ